MSFSGVCQVCESAEADYACEQCGAFVCTSHFDRKSRRCGDCRPSPRGGGGAEPDVGMQ
ncbi:hypothetical protein ACFO0N_04765 [Halobium salinum]|uniref:HIT zinc finger n=1 Tax=Halobium salinum TaxID=1364940 RepID=A0ABD5P8Q5_9EURY|nr:hypothetical protein [Halobium salinum]